MELIAAFIIGLLGSLHCVGMCGPIALALPVSGNSRWARVFAAILYNAGRVVTYALLGTLFGSLGNILWLMNMQQALSIGLGITILIVVLSPVIFTGFITTPAFYRSTLSGLQSALASQIKKHTSASLFIIGLLNGLLPCGFVYIGLAGATTAGHWYTGALYMALFGLGTLPLMVTLILIKNRISFSVRKQLSKALPYVMVFIASLFIVRGMNLGIPYLSPKAQTDSVKHNTNPTTILQPVNCH